MADPVTPKNKSIPLKVPATPAVKDAVLKQIGRIDKVLQAQDDPAQTNIIIQMIDRYLDGVEEKPESTTNQSSSTARATAMGSLQDTAEAEAGDENYVDSGHDNSAEDEVEEEVEEEEVEDNVDDDIPNFLKEAIDQEETTREEGDGYGGNASAGQRKEAEHGDDAPAKQEARGSNTKKATTKVSRAKEKKLLPIMLDISDNWNVDNITAARDKFFAAVHGLTVKMKKNNKNIIKEITEEEAVDITNFFFSQIMGRPALSRLSSLVQSYNKHSDGEPDKGISERADEAAKNTKHATLKHFFATMGAVTRASRPNNSIIQQIYHLHTLKDLAEAYMKLIAEVSTKKLTAMGKEKKKRLLEELESQGYSTDIGQGWKTAVNKYICDKLGYTQTILTNKVQSGKVVQALVDEFGTGIIPVIPIGGLRDLQNFNALVLVEVYPILNQKAPVLRELCQIVDNIIYQPLIIGQPLRVREIKTTSKIFMDSLLKDAKELEAAEVENVDMMEVDL